MGKLGAYDLWFDESGRFEETSPAASVAPGTTPQRFPSQLAGLVVRRGELTTAAAQKVMADAHRAAGLDLTDEVHGTAMSREAFQTLVAAVVPAIRARGWQPVRLVNLEGVSYGDRVSTYTQIVAELVLRVLRALSSLATTRHDAIEIHVYPAVVKIGEREGAGPELLGEAEYMRRLREALGFIAVRRGAAPEAERWRVTGLTLLSGRHRRELQLCDLLSNASHAAFKKVGPELRAALVEAFGAFDHTLVLDEVLERVDDLVDDGGYGRALALLAEAGVDPERARREGVQTRLGVVLTHLAAMGARTRDPELSTLVNLVEQLVEHRRDVERGGRLIAFLLTEVEAPLRAQLGARGDTIDWFAHSLRRWELTAANHAGALVVAKAAAAELDRLAPRLAGRWEHAALLVDGMIARAVHRTDCFAYDEASSLMDRVVAYYGHLSGLFHGTLPAVPDRLRSRARGEALGTRLQAEMAAGLRDPKRLAVARELSDLALDELVAHDDLARQHQYRCQLETLAGDFPRARKHLAASLGAEATHASIGAAIAAMPPSSGQGFALLHWLRLGRDASIRAAADRADFDAALKSAGALDLPWAAGERADYPAHAVLRYAACLRAMRGSMKETLACVGHLRRARSTLGLRAVLVASLVEVAGLLWATRQSDARRLLDQKDAASPGALQTLTSIGDEARDGVPELWEAFSAWEGTIRGVLKGIVARDPRAVLLGLGREVP